MTDIERETAEWLSSRTDDELAELLRLRPDLTVPPASNFDVLAGRSLQRASVMRASEDLDTLTLTILEHLLIDGADIEPVTRRALDAHLTGRAPKKAVDAALTQLRARALIRGTAEIVAAPSARDAVPWRVGRARSLDSNLTEETVRAALEDAGTREYELLYTLAASSTIGRTRDAAPGTPEDRPVQKLLAAGLLTWLDENTVELPPQVAQVLRDEPVTDPSALTPPAVTNTTHRPADIDSTAAGEALELLRQCAAVLEALGSSPAPTLRAGGLGVREVRRLAKNTDVDEARVGLIVELLSAAGLISSGLPDPPPVGGGTGSLDDMWAPTSAVDTWATATPAARWAALATAWLDVMRMPGLIGLRDPSDKPIAALSDEVRSGAAPRDRRVLLDILAQQKAGHALTEVDLARLAAWCRPRLAARFALAPVGRVLAEATALGITARGALSSAGRALLDNAADPAEAMDRSLPEPIDHVLIQADLTVVAPGPLTADLAARLKAVADIESTGAATVYRITEASLRRALDAGTTAAEISALLTTHSRTPVPQALTYLVDDVARRHGRLRAGVASSFVRCEDPALLAEVLASPAAQALALRSLAPTVAISQAPLVTVLERLRDAGFTPAGEDSSGTIVDLRPKGSRVPARRVRHGYRGPTVPTNEQLARLITEMRAGTRAASMRRHHGVRADGTRASGAATISLLQQAAVARSSVSIGYVDVHGVATHRVVEPVTIGGGRLDAWDPATQSMRQFTLHRITSVDLVS